MDSDSNGQKLFHAAIASLVASDIEAYTSNFAEDGIIEWPFAPSGWRDRVEGRAAIAEYVGGNLTRAKASGRRLVAAHDVRFHEVDPRTFIVEFAVEVASSDGTSRRMPYVHVYELDAAGQIRRLRDYFGVATADVVRPNLAVKAFERIAAATRAWDGDAFADAFAVDAVMSWPFAPKEFPQIVEGREAIRAQMKAMMARADAAGRRIVGYHDVVAHPGKDPANATIEFKAEREMADGRRSSIAYVWILETRDGEITRLRDHYDSFAAVHAFSAR